MERLAPSAMKRTLLLLLPLLTGGCLHEAETAAPPRTDVATLDAATERTTRTALGDDGLSVVWSTGDAIGLWSASATQPARYTLEEASAGSTAGRFTGTAVEGTPRYALYPQQAIVSADDATCRITLPTRQTFAAEGFGPQANPMAASGETMQLTFHNLCGVIDLQVTGSARITGVEAIAVSEALSGSFRVDFPADGLPTLTPDGNTSNHLALSGVDVTLGSAPTHFHLVVPPGTYAEGLAFTLTDAAGTTMTVNTRQPLTVKRSVITQLAPVAYTPGSVEYRYDEQTEWTPWNTPDGVPRFTTRLSLHTTGQAAVSVEQFAAIAAYLGTLDANATSVVLDFSQSRFETPLFPATFQELISRYPHLHEISLPSNITAVATSAFMGCSNLTVVELPDGVVSLGDLAFTSCLSLPAIELPATLEHIGKECFFHCSALGRIELPAALRTIDTLAFGYCSLLGEIAFRSATAPTVAANAFGSSDETASQAGNRVPDAKRLLLPVGATGYAGTAWYTLLTDTGFTVEEQ